MMSMIYREYAIRLTINRRKFRRVLIDPHYEKRHQDMDDATILSLVKGLEGAEHVAKFVTAAGFEIYVTEPIFHAEKPHRVVWTTHPCENYIGVNLPRRKRRGITGARSTLRTPSVYEGKEAFQASLQPPGKGDLYPAPQAAGSYVTLIINAFRRKRAKILEP